jgi:hypothetical protein
MYVARFKRKGMRWKVSLFEKRWSDSMYSNEISELKNKSFFFRTSAQRWINKEMRRIMFEQHKLEIIDG